VNNHAFNDANKRIGVFAMMTFMELNNLEVEYLDEELITLGLNTASGKTGQEQILSWIIAPMYLFRPGCRDWCIHRAIIGAETFGLTCKKQ